ncbi:MAG: hypothetical protein K2I42_02155, partial [Anaeroplasmataceae bacterium]|nr:hypothetical protein [Anaeroplasmataceae bacterium]
NIREKKKWFTYINKQEGEEKGTLKKLCINIRDLIHNGFNLYDSTFLSYVYEQKKNNVVTFTSLTPSTEELSKCSSGFFDKINQK